MAIHIRVPGYDDLELEHLVLDYNGTLACDGKLLKGVADCLKRLSKKLEIHVVTADTFGHVKLELVDVPCSITILPLGSQDEGKREYIINLNPDVTVCIGNGRNDRLMLKEAALGIAVIMGEGAARGAILSADVISTDIVSALKLLENPLRLTATLRS
ncbi:MAG: ATPase P [Desulfobacterales bacterium]|nr:ATPase P [Desulfobacterales bacterium]